MKSNLFGRLMVFSMIALSMAATRAQAQTELPQPSGYAGLALGYADPSDLNGRLGYGANIGLKFPYGLGAGLFFLNSAGSENGIDTAISHYGIEAHYGFAFFDAEKPQPGFGSPAPGLKLGARLGASTFGATGTNAPAGKTSFTAGPSVAYDIEIPYGLTVGADVSAMFTFGERSGSTLYALATTKYWF